MVFNFQRIQSLLLMLVFALAMQPALAAKPPHDAGGHSSCGEPFDPNFGGKIMVFGDSFAALLQGSLGRLWLDDTRKDLLDETPLPHIAEWFPDSKINTGLAQPFETDRASKKKIFYPQVLANLIAEYELRPKRLEGDKPLPADIVIIWFGANDFNSMLKDDLISIPLGYPGWFEHYQARLENVMEICAAKKLDCYFLTPTDTHAKTAPHGYGPHMAEIKKRMEAIAARPDLQESVTVIDMWTLRKRFSRSETDSDYAHPTMFGFEAAAKEVNDKIAQKRGFDLARLADNIRRCK
jgi:lysophospholipase L1-like esterase